MSYLHAILLAIVEGITEFLPISSTGHQVLVANLLHIPQTEFVKTFEIFIQLGAILSVVYLYLPTLLKNFDLWKKLFVAFIPSAIIGFAFFKFITDTLLGNPEITLQALFWGGALLILLEIIHREKEHHLDQLGDLNYRQALLIGIFQSFSVIPGVSRAAATIVGGLIVGLKRRAAVEFSFLLAIPTMVAATTLNLYKSDLNFSSQEITVLGIGFIVSFLVALVAVKFLINFIKSHTFIPFGIYRIALAVIYFIVIIGI